MQMTSRTTRIGADARSPRRTTNERADGPIPSKNDPDSTKYSYLLSNFREAPEACPDSMRIRWKTARWETARWKTAQLTAGWPVGTPANAVSSPSMHGPILNIYGILKERSSSIGRS